MEIWTRNTKKVPTVTDDKQMKTVIKNIPDHTTQEITEILYISHMSFVKKLKTLRYVNHYYVWMSHDSMEWNIIDNIYITGSFYKHNKNDGFFKRMVTGDEKWIVYSNVKWESYWGKWNSVCIARKWCYVSAGIGKALCILNSFHKTSHWIQRGTALKWTNWRQKSIKKTSQNCQLEGYWLPLEQC